MQAGGKTSDAVTGMSCLDIKINAVDQVCGVSGGWVGVGVGVFVVGLDREEMMLCLNIFMCLLCFVLRDVGEHCSDVDATVWCSKAKPPHYLNLPEVVEFADVC